MVYASRIARSIAVVTLALSAGPLAAVAQPQTQPTVLVQQSPEYAEVRARFEGMTEEQIHAAGYHIESECITASDAGLPAELGGMGYHAIHPQYWSMQFRSGQLDPMRPTLLLLDANKRVVGLEWEADDTIEPAPVLFGQTLVVQPGHPGVPEVNEPHYMLHSYFRPNGMVLFSVWDPQLQCAVAQAQPVTPPQPAAPAQPVAAQPARPAAVAAPAAPLAAPAQVPSALPRTGEPISASPALFGLGLTLLLAGAVMLRRQANGAL